MFATIRKHQTWLWAFIIAAVIVSFVIYFTPNADRQGGSGRASQFGTMDGRPINRKEYLEAYVEARLAFLLRYGVWPDSSEARRSGVNMERETRTRLVVIDRLQKLNVKPGEAAVAQWIVDNFGGKDPESAKPKYEQFLVMLRKQHGVNGDAVHRFIEHEIGAGHLADVTGIPGLLVTPRSAATLYRQQNEKIEAEAVVFSASNHLAQVTLDATALSQYYSNRLSQYRTPERVQVDYVKFPMSNYLAQAEQSMAQRTNLAAEIEQIYLSSNPSSYRDTNGQALPPDAIRARIREQYRDREALVQAHREAARFATNLEAMPALTPDTLAQLAKEKSLAIATTEPFSESEGPAGLKVRDTFTSLAFKLTAENPVALSPIRGEDAVYQISLRRKIPSDVPALASIRARVESEYRQETALRLAREAGTNFAAQATAGLAAGKTFAAVCTENGVTPIPMPSFSASSRSVPDWDRRVELPTVRSAAARLAAGAVSALAPSREGGVVVHVKSRTPVTEEALKQELPKFLANVRGASEYEAFNDWFRRQVESSRVSTPFDREESR